MDGSLTNCLQDWSQDDLSNLGAILEIKNEKPSVADIESEIQWLYHSKIREKLATGAIKTLAKIGSFLNKEKKEIPAIDERYPPPSYTALINNLAEILKVLEKDEPVVVLEENISLAIIIKALGKMKPSQRRAYFYERVDFSELLEAAGIADKNLRRPMTTMAILGAANAGGFSTYLASTTALGFLTHAVGITLPFAVYTGLTSSIAFVTGPIGLLAVGTWGILSATGPEWKKLTPAIIYIISKNSHRQLSAQQ